MERYQRVVVGLELDSFCDEVILKKAAQIREQFKSELFFVHSVEHLANYGAAYGVAAGADVEQILLDEAGKAMAKKAKQYDIDKSHQLIRFGPAKVVILDEAEKIKADLIILGSHGRHGVRLLLGSTANAVIHGAKCDVLAVRVYEKK
jgi:universal stress protein A